MTVGDNIFATRHGRRPVNVADEADMMRLGGELVTQLPRGSLITLSGELGAGKSVLVRAMIHTLGYPGRVKSPTYTLIETYDVPGAPNVHKSKDDSGLRIAHLDLYRLSDPDELEYLGFDDVISTADYVFIEWPERCADRLPQATLHVQINYGDNDSRIVWFIDPVKSV